MADDDNALKSSYELAMERLRKKDEEAGIETRPITDAQKTAIAEIRSFYEAKIAQADVLYRSKLQRAYTPEEQDTLAQEFRRDREHFESARDAKIETIRAQR
jgi:hypothetical protein